MLEKAVVRRLRVGVVPNPALERLSVGYGTLTPPIRGHLDSLRSGDQVATMFVRGEWGTGKSHFLAFVRLIATMEKIAASIVPLNARSAPLNAPQRFYPRLVANLEGCDSERGLRALLPIFLHDAEQRKRLLEFAGSRAAGDLGWQLRAVGHRYDWDDASADDAEWAWTRLLGGDLSWADYPYKRRQALARIQALALMLRHLGLGGLVVTLDEAETIDQLWNVRSRLVAYDVLGQLTSMTAVWCVVGITDRFVRTVETDLDRGVVDWPDTSDHAKTFLGSWRKKQFEILDLPTIDNPLARSLVRAVADLYCGAYSLPLVNHDFVSRCVTIWAKNPGRNPRRLIRLTVHHLDLVRSTGG